MSGAPAWALRIGVIVALVVGGYLVFELGRIQGGYSLIDADREEAALRAEIADLQETIVGLNEDLVLQQTHREIDRAAYDDVEINLQALQQKIQEQRDAIEFYRGIMAPEDGGRGLRVQGVKLSRGVNEREYVVRLVLVQVLKHDSTVRGDVNLVLEGEQDGVAAEYSLDELIPGDEDSSWPFQFRYFQSFDRQLILPDGFMPERLNVQVRSRTKSVDSIEQTFAWHTVQG